METANRVFGRHLAITPARFVLRAGNANQREAHPVRIGEGQQGFAEALFQRFMSDALGEEAMGPIAQRAGRNAERRLLGLADTTTAGACAFPREERQDRPGSSGLVAIVEMIGAGIVEIDGLLDEAQSQASGIKVIVSQGVTRNRGDVVNAGHGVLLLA